MRLNDDGPAYNVHIDQFDFDLPESLIAQTPCEPRDGSRLLVVNRNACDHSAMLQLADHLDPGDLLVVNDTRVIPAQLTGKRGDAQIRLTLHKALGLRDWMAFAKPARKCRPGDIIHLSESCTLHVVDNVGNGEVHIRFEGTDDVTDILHQYGAMPLPPYIKRPEGQAPDESDQYQTLFASAEGAVAAPTAGLHFTPRLVSALSAQNVEMTALTLHVGAGTFLPVKVDNISEHRMHEEVFSLGEEACQKIRQTQRNGGRIIAVGTTVTRTLEAIHHQYGELRPASGATDIFITPGFRFQVIDRLLTNFHLPRSTLLMLVSAFAGRERMLSAYAEAIEKRYRFFSYGDACLLTRDAKT